MRKNYQQVEPKNMTCVPCRNGICFDCVDVLRLQVFPNSVCECEKQDHNVNVMEMLYHKKVMVKFK